MRSIFLSDIHGNLAALDAVKHGFKTTVRLDACRGIDLAGSVEAMLKRMREAGVTLEDHSAD